MATYKSDYDYFVKQNLGSTNQMIKDRQTANTNMSNQYVADVNAIVDKNIANAVNKVETQISGLPTQYQSAFDINAIQQKINERQAAEHMANTGRTDSGLNRTQQTAFAVQRSNADAALRQQMNAATVSLKQQIADLYASGESQKAETAAKARYELSQANQGIYNTYMDNLYSSANAYAENQANNRAAIEKERIKAAQKQQEQYTKWALENGYGYDASGNLVYTGKVKNSDGEYVYIDDAYDLNDNSISSAKSYTTKSNSDYNDAYDYALLNGVPEDIASTRLMKRSEWTRSKTHGSTYEEYVDWFVSNYGNSKTPNLPYGSKPFTLE